MFLISILNLTLVSVLSVDFVVFFGCVQISSCLSFCCLLLSHSLFFQPMLVPFVLFSGVFFLVILLVDIISRHLCNDLDVKDLMSVWSASPAEFIPIPILFTLIPILYEFAKITDV